MIAKKLIIAWLISLFMVTFLAQVVFAEDKIPVTGVYLETTELVMKVFTTEEISAWVIPTNASNKIVSWHSGDKNKVQIIERTGSTVIIEALAPGTTNIYVTTEDGQFQNYCRVEVVVPIRKIFLEPLEVVLAPGEELQFEATLEPEYATSSDLKWQSSDNGVVTVDNNGLATAYKSGEARVIARAVDNEQILAYSNVTVTENQSDENIDQADPKDNDQEELPEVVDPVEIEESAAEEQPVDNSPDYSLYINLGLGFIILVIIVLLVLLIKQRRSA